MQDDWLKIMGAVTNGMSTFTDLEKQIAPHLVAIQKNADRVDPALMSKLNESLADISVQKKKLQRLKAELNQNVKRK